MKRLLLGGGLIIFGVLQLIFGGAAFRRVPLSPGQGLIFIIMGILIIVLIKRMPTDETELLICENCKKEFKLRHVMILVCPICNGKLFKHQNKTKKGK